MHVEEAYVNGRPLRDVVDPDRRQASSPVSSSTAGGAGTGSTAGSGGATAAAAAGVPGKPRVQPFRQSPLAYLTALTASGEYVAAGNRLGRIVVMKRRAMTPAQHRVLLEQQRELDALDGLDVRPSRLSSSATAMYSAPRARDLYDFQVSHQAYVYVIDPLNSVGVHPSITALSFLPQTSPGMYLLTANEKVPKLYKIMSARESANQFRAVDKLDTKMVGPLTASSRQSSVAMKVVASYALNHEYTIHSICPLADSEQFVSADDLTLQLWCTDYPGTSVETYSLLPPPDEEPREAIRSVQCFPHEPFLLFASTTAGCVRVIDIRQSLRWMQQAPQAFWNPPHDEDGSFSTLTSSICDCALSPCGRYIAGRDFMTVCLWDVRMASAASSGSPVSHPTRSYSAAAAAAAMEGYGEGPSVVRSWQLHPQLRDSLEALHASDVLFQRFNIHFLNGNQVCTGGLESTLYTVDVTQAASRARRDPAAGLTTPSPGVRAFSLPNTDDVVDVRRGPIVSRPASTRRRSSARAEDPSFAFGEEDGVPAMDLGPRVTLLSRPAMSRGGVCGMMASCGQVLMQVSYKGFTA